MAGRVGGRAAEPGEREAVAVQGARLLEDPALRVGLPDLDQGVGDRLAATVEDQPVETYGVRAAGRDQLAVARPGERVVEERADRLSRGGRQVAGRAAHASSSIRVRWLPVSTMSQR